MSLNPLKTKYPTTSLVLIVLLCMFLGASIVLFLYEHQSGSLYESEKDEPTQGDNIVCGIEDYNPGVKFAVFGAAGGAVVGLMLGTFVYVKNKGQEQIETINLLEK